MGCQLFIEERVNYVLKDAENIKALEDRILNMTRNLENMMFLTLLVP